MHFQYKSVIIIAMFVAGHTFDRHAIISLIDSSEVEAQIRRTVLKHDTTFDPGHERFRRSEGFRAEQARRVLFINVFRGRCLRFVLQES